MKLRYPRHMLSRELALLVTVFPVLLNAKAQETKKHVPAHPFPAQLIQELTTLRDAALADDYAYEQVAYLTENIGARPSGSAQAEKAVDYVAAELRKLGLEVKLEEVKCPTGCAASKAGELVAFPGTSRKAPHTRSF